jgi:antirestriction protein ArdC
MSKNFKPLYTQVAEQLATQLRAGTSPLQKPIKDDGTAAFLKPVNPFTGKGYSALNALNLGLKGFPDPRFMSLKDANYHNFVIKADEKGTLINFKKTSDIEAVRDASGNKMKDGEGNTQTRKIEYEKPKKASPFLFNATQMKEFPPLEEFLQKRSAADNRTVSEKAEKIIADSGAVIIHGGNEAYYDKMRDAIFLPEKENFPNEKEYYQAAFHQLAHWTGHESRLNRPMDGKFGSMEYGREELRAALASMLIGAETGIGNNFPHHAAYSNGWAKQLNDKPYEMSAIARDAQKSVSILLGYGQKREEKKSTAQSSTLTKGEVIPYNKTNYTITDKKSKTVTIQKEDTGDTFKVKPSDKLYKNLVEARNNPQSLDQDRGQTNGPSQQKEPEMALEETHSYKVGR